MSSLCLHAGGYAVDYADLLNVSAPAATHSYKPVRHHDFWNLVTDTVEDQGFKILNTQHALAKGGLHYFGLMEIAKSETEFLKDGFSTIVGARTSHDKKFPAGLVCGSQVFVCDNLAFSGEINVIRKHTTRVHVDLPQLIYDAVLQLGSLELNQIKQIESYKGVKIDQTVADHLLMELYRTPCLLLQGQQDDRVDWTRVQDFAAQCPYRDIEFHLYADGDHRLNDRKERLWDLMVTYLRGRGLLNSVSS